MTRSRLRPLVVAALALAPVLVAFGGDAKAPPEAPKPPTTPEPAFENPLADAKVGETLFYKVRDLEGRWTRYFQERVLALDKTDALIEVVEMDEGQTKIYSVDGPSTGWRARGEKLVLPADQPLKWLVEREKKEILFIGEPPTKAIRTTHRYLEEPAEPGRPEAGKRVREIWFSHDLPATGRAKMFPAQRGGERMVISWDKTLSAEECATRAPRYPKPDPKADGGTSSPSGPSEPGMGEPGMAEPGAGEPGMAEPGAGEPGMGEGGMSEPEKPDAGMGG